jgi:drug/metabolite transporter (DMT)-like permease
MSSSTEAQGEKKALLNLPNKDGRGNYSSIPTAKPSADRKSPVPPLDKDESDEEANSTTLVVAFIAMIVFQLGNRIYGRLMTYPMHNYPSFLNILAVFMYCPLCFLYIWPMRKWGSSITQEQLDIPKFKFAVMGAYDSIAGIMQTFAINYITNAGTIVLVQQSAIPISMAISVYTLGATYTKSQYTGAAVVLMGIMVVLVPQLFPDMNENNAVVTHMRGGHVTEHAQGLAMEGTSDGVPSAMDTSSTSELMWILILVVSCVPMVLSSVYKEKALGELEIDVIYLNGWVAVFQFLMSIPLILPSSWVISMATDQIIPNMYGGFWCWLGVNTITEENPGDNNLPLDHCEMAPFYVNMYLFFNVVFNVLIVVILKHGSSNILWLSSTIIVPMSNIAFSMKIMPGHQDLTDFDIVGLAVIMKGLLIYRFWPQIALSLKKCSPCSKDDDEFDEEDIGDTVSRRIERKQTKYLGLGQMEALSALMGNRIQNERRTALFRSPQQIRGSLLLKLGIPPSPHFSVRPGVGKNLSRGNSFIELKKQQQSKKIRS